MVNKAVPKKRNVNKTTFKKKPKSMTIIPRGNKLEKKSFEFGAVALAVPSTTFTTPQSINLVRLGTAATNRVGRQIQLKSVVLRNHSLLPLRTIIVYDKSGQNGSATVPAITDILQADAITSHHNLNNKERFVTILDTFHEPQTTTSGSVQESFRRIDLTTVFAADTGADSDFATGTLWVLYSTSAAQGTLTSRIRTRYTDA